MGFGTLDYYEFMEKSSPAGFFSKLKGSASQLDVKIEYDTDIRYLFRVWNNLGPSLNGTEIIAAFPSPVL